MGIYSGTQIQAAIENGSIVCVPFHSQRLSSGGLQVTLGSYYYRTEQTDGIIHNPLNAEDNEQYLDGPFRALTHERQCALSGLKAIPGLPPEAPVILLGPGERIVAHTHEFIGTLPTDRTHLEELPGWHQSGIVVTPNFIEATTITRLSLIIQNVNAQKTILLPVGAPIAQLILYRSAATEADASELTTTTEARLDTDTIDRAISTWAPSSILANALPLPVGLPVKIEGLSYE